MGNVFTTAQTGNEPGLNMLQRSTMLATILTVVLVLWLLGVVTSYTMGGFIHILLVVAVVAVLIRVIQGRNPLAG